MARFCSSCDHREGAWALSAEETSLEADLTLTRAYELAISFCLRDGGLGV